ncbi:MFS transporter [Lentibacillus salicampi]|uniref:MFS transporter n=1 Tax=Lentibacillus salicampi TaxID=175306 RepID=A0A4Y9A6A1_9BACI|nr:MFS transporter [Lentibacillus salicampi]TFJ90640.1 MFS transporter [Lentibacillus salicampi]
MEKRKIRTLIVLITSVFAFSIVGSRPLIPLYANTLGATNFLVGIIVALFSFFPLFISVKLGRVVDKKGVKKLLCLGLLFGAVSLIIPFFINNLTGLIISQIIAGTAQIIYIVAMQSYAGGFADREYYINLFSISIAIGSFLGPLFSGFISDIYSYTIALMIGGVLLLLVIPLVSLFKEHEIRLESEEEDKLENFNMFSMFKLKSLQYAFLVSVLVLFAKDTYIAFFPLLASEHGINNSIIGLIISLNAAAGILIRLMLPFLLAHMSRRIIINMSILISGLIFLLHPLVSSTTLSAVLFFVDFMASGSGMAAHWQS